MAVALPTLALVAVLANDPPVYRDEDTRPVLEEMARRRRPDDAIYVYYAAERAFRFYGPRVGLPPGAATFGDCHRGDPRAYLRELDTLRGRPRVWVFRSHVSAALAEQPILDAYLARLGTRKETIAASDTDAALWDLSTARDVPSDAAESQPLPGWDASALVHLGCGHGPIGPAPADWK
jgi:hypothetical protein